MRPNDRGPTPRGRTLTESEIAALDPVESGHVRRAICPFCGSNGERALQIDRRNGRLHCFYCNEWGYTAEARREYRARNAGGESGGASRARPAPPAGDPSAFAAALGRIREGQRREGRPCRPGLDAELERFRKALRGSPAEIYLARRRIPLELAESLGAGFAARGTWPCAETGRGARVRDWVEGRIVFPHRAPDGTILNLYSRVIENSGKAEDEIRHDHLGGAKGYFNAPALNRSDAPVFVCEGVFDALSLMAAGVPLAIAIFGVGGWRWIWARSVHHLIFAMDADEAGSQWQSIAVGARVRGIPVSYVPVEAFGGHKDVAAAWAAGVLQIEHLSVPAPPPPDARPLDPAPAHETPPEPPPERDEDCETEIEL